MNVIKGVTRYDAHGRTVDRTEVALHRTRDSEIHLHIGPSDKSRITKSYSMPLSEFLELLGGTVTPAEIARLYGIGASRE